jgi:hypothetical protein
LCQCALWLSSLTFTSTRYTCKAKLLCLRAKREAWRELLCSSMRVSSHQEEKDAKERRERRMTYATSLPAIRVPPHLQASSSPSAPSSGGHGVKHAATSVAYLQSAAEAPDRRLKERIYQSELDALRATETQVGRKVAQANIRSAWLADQLEQRKQEERELEHKVEQEKRKWLKRRELEAEIEKLRDQLKEAWGAIASGHSLEAERHADTYVRPGPPDGTLGLRVPTVCVLYVPKAQGSLPPGPHALYVRRTRASLGRAVCTVHRVTPQAEREKQALEATEAAKKNQTRHLAQVCVARMCKRSLYRGFMGFRAYAEERQLLLRRMAAWAKVPPGRAPARLPCLLGFCLAALGALIRSQGEPRPLGSQAPPRVLELAASKVGHLTALTIQACAPPRRGSSGPCRRRASRTGGRGGLPRRTAIRSRTATSPWQTRWSDALPSRRRSRCSR